MKRIDSVDGLRGLAALIVVIFHYQSFFGMQGEGLGWGFLAVDLFFVLSGFILCEKYIMSLEEARISYGRFVIRRIARLWPLHVFSLSLVLALHWYLWVYLGKWRVVETYNTSELFLNLFLLQGFNHSSLQLNPPSWSISSEFIFNLIWALLVCYRWNCITAFLLVIFGSAFLIYHSISLQIPVSTNLLGIVNVGLLRCTIGFSIGYLIFRFKSRLCCNNWIALGILGGVISCLYFYQSLQRFGVDYVIALALFPALILVTIEDTFVAAFFRRFRFLGTISYSVYLLQVPIAHGMSLLLLHGLGKPPPYWGMMYISILLISSSLGYYLIERPAQRLINLLPFYSGAKGPS